jgi:hypothetical protein
MFKKAWTFETAKKVTCRDPVGMVKARLLEPQGPFCQGPRPDTAEGYPVLRRTPPNAVTVHTRRGAGQRLLSQGPEPGTYRRPERRLRTEYGMAYRGRPPGPQSLHSSQRTGKPSTGPREAGKPLTWVCRYG